MSQQFVCDVCGALVQRPGGLTVDEAVQVPLRGQGTTTFVVGITLSVQPSDSDKDICKSCAWKQVTAVRDAELPNGYTN